MTAKNYVTYY